MSVHHKTAGKTFAKNYKSLYCYKKIKFSGPSSSLVLGEPATTRRGRKRQSIKVADENGELENRRKIRRGRGTHNGNVPIIT